MTEQEAATDHPNIIQFIKDEMFPEPRKKPSEVVKALSASQFLSAIRYLTHHTKPIQRCLVSRRKREEAKAAKEAEAKALWGKFCGYVHAKVASGGVWVHAIAKDGKHHYGDYSTKSRVEEAARAYPDLTLRLQPYGDNIGDTALAIFRGPRIETETLEDQALPI